MDIHNIVLLGEAGSGKTEIAANIAILLAEKDEKPVYLIDMDQTKCLFRARDFSSLLEKRQVHMAENQELWDSPLVPMGVSALLKDEGVRCVFDAGGNAAGAAMMGQFAGLLAGKTTRYYYVINPCRAFSGSMEDILESLSAILISAMVSARVPAGRLEVIANPYMGGYTTAELIAGYYRRLEQELAKLDLSIKCLAVSKTFSSRVRKQINVPMLELDTFVDKLYV